VVRDLGLSDRGITGLTYQDTLGTADPSTGTRISTAVIDAYFLLGGGLYGWATQRNKSPQKGRRPPATEARTPVDTGIGVQEMNPSH
jgi:hypothetical protein